MYWMHIEIIQHIVSFALWTDSTVGLYNRNPNSGVNTLFSLSTLLRQ